MFSLLSLIKFVHIIAAMVYFGLPFAFGRWFSNIADGDQWFQGVFTMKRFVSLHLNLSAFILFTTGFYLAYTMGFWTTGAWTHLSMGLLFLSVINLNFNLGLALSKVLMASGKEPMDNILLHKTRMRIMIFSAIHHTLVTGATALMVFRI